MNYRLLGNSGLRVSDVSLGAMTFGEDWGWGASADEARRIYDAYRDAGGNFVDTANVYTNGTSESLLGTFMDGHRDAVVLATKYTNDAAFMGGGGVKHVNAGGNHRKSMMTAVEHCLRRLKTDYIDLYYLHVWDQLTPVEEVVRGFDDLVRQGKVLHPGVSDAPAWWVSRAVTLQQQTNAAPFAALQIEYSLLERTVERELIPMAKALNLTVVAWSPLAGGMLSGKYRNGKPGGRLDDAAMREFAAAYPERIDRAVDAVSTVAGELNISLARVALAWLRHRPVSVIPIVGARKLDQLADNLAAADVKLSAEQVTALDAATSIELGFPHDFYNRDMVRNLVYAGYADRDRALTMRRQTRGYARASRDEYRAVPGLALADAVERGIDIVHRERLDHRPDAVAGGEGEHLLRFDRRARDAAADYLFRHQQAERVDRDGLLRQADDAELALRLERGHVVVPRQIGRHGAEDEVERAGGLLQVVGVFRRDETARAEAAGLGLFVARRADGRHVAAPLGEVLHREVAEPRRCRRRPRGRPAARRCARAVRRRWCRRRAAGRRVQTQWRRGSGRRTASWLPARGWRSRRGGRASRCRRASGRRSVGRSRSIRSSCTTRRSPRRRRVGRP